MTEGVKLVFVINCHLLTETQMSICEHRMYYGVPKEKSEPFEKKF